MNATVDAGPGVDIQGVDADLFDVIAGLQLPGRWSYSFDDVQSVRITPYQVSEQLDVEVFVRVFVDGPTDDRMWHITAPTISIGDQIGADHVERTSSDQEYPELAGTKTIVNATTVTAARRGLLEAIELVYQDAHRRAVRSVLSDDSGELPAGIGESTVSKLAEQIPDSRELQMASKAYLTSLEGVGDASAEKIYAAIGGEQA